MPPRAARWRHAATAQRVVSMIDIISMPPGYALMAADFFTVFVSIAPLIATPPLFDSCHCVYMSVEMSYFRLFSLFFRVRHYYFDADITPPL